MLIKSLQEISGKFEEFQQPADYDGRLGRLARQLADLQANLYLTELVSHEPEAIQVLGPLHFWAKLVNICAGSAAPHPLYLQRAG